MPVELYLDCPTCARPALFEQPSCADGHGADCPEWCCVDCGCAVLLGTVFLGTAPRVAETARPAAVAEPGRRAA